MQLEELIILLPCHSLEDFPLYLEADDADDLLATWSATCTFLDMQQAWGAEPFTSCAEGLV